MDRTEASSIRDRALQAHIAHGMRELDRISQQIQSLMNEHDHVKREVEAMLKAQATLVQEPPATEPEDTPESAEDPTTLEALPYEEI